MTSRRLEKLLLVEELQQLRQLLYIWHQGWWVGCNLGVAHIWARLLVTLVLLHLLQQVLSLPQLSLHITDGTGVLSCTGGGDQSGTFARAAADVCVSPRDVVPPQEEPGGVVGPHYEGGDRGGAQELPGTVGTVTGHVVQPGGGRVLVTCRMSNISLGNMYDE